MSNHGTRTRYVAGCRCDLCREAHRLYYHDWMRRTLHARYGAADPLMCEAEPVALRLDALCVSGYSLRELSRVTGLKRQTLSRIRRRERRRVTQRVAATIAAVEMLDEAQYEHETTDAILFGTKTCDVCGADLPKCTTYFGTDRYAADGLNTTCKPCRREQGSDRYATDPEYREKRRAQMRARYARTKAGR